MCPLGLGFDDTASAGAEHDFSFRVREWDWWVERGTLGAKPILLLHVLHTTKSFGAMEFQTRKRVVNCPAWSRRAKLCLNSFMRLR